MQINVWCNGNNEGKSAQSANRKGMRQQKKNKVTDYDELDDFKTEVEKSNK